MQIFGNVEFSGSFASLAVAHLFSVHPDIHRRFYAAKVEENLTAVPSFRDRKVSSVGAYRIIVMGDVRWVGRKKIIGICIHRDAKTLQFPIAWHDNIIPLSNIKIIFVEIDRPLGRFFNPVEFPGSVKRKIVRRLRRIVLQSCLSISVGNICAMGRFFVPSDHRRVFPVIDFISLCFLFKRLFSVALIGNRNI